MENTEHPKGILRTSSESGYRPDSGILMPTLISAVTNNLSLNTSSSTKVYPRSYSEPTSSSSVDTGPPESRSHHERIEPQPKEMFHPDDDTSNANPHSNAYDTLVDRCGSGYASQLRKCATIQRLDPNCEVYLDILDYVKNSKAEKKITVKTIYKVQRFSDNENRINESYRIILWHGTSPNAVPGIIETGFRKGKAGMFGGGIYFADRIAKSLVYTEKDKKTGLGYLILAETIPGKVYKAHNFHTDYKKPPRDFDSVKGNGRDIPSWKNNRDYFGAIMPCGPTCINQRHQSYKMPYNEYILYDMDRVILRFIVECKL